MAQIHSHPAAFAREAAVRKRRNLVHVALAWIIPASAIGGFALAISFRSLGISTWASCIVIFSAALVVMFACKWVIPKLDQLDRERLNWESGANGEGAVGLQLARLPADFEVIHDFQTPTGNLDHVVIGPTGVFVIDAKNWRGVVSADGKGELLLNDRPTIKPTVSPLVRRIMNTRDQIMRRSRSDVYFQTLLVFTSAHVAAKWGTTGKAHCLRDGQLVDYIENARPRRKLTRNEVQLVTQAFRDVARADADSENAASQTISARTPALQAHPV